MSFYLDTYAHVKYNHVGYLTVNLDASVDVS